MISLCRVLIGGIVPLRAGYASGSLLDDYLMVQYAQLSSHFHPASAWDMTWALTKTMSYPYFLNVLMATGIPYRLAVSLLWVMGALLTVMALHGLWDRSAGKTRQLPSLFWAVSYAFLIFSPVAFDEMTGTRIYRESILPPVVLMLVGLMGLWVIAAVDCYHSRSGAMKRQFVWSLALGIVWVCFWFVKESSVWLMPTFLGVMLVILGIDVAGVVRLVCGHVDRFLIMRRGIGLVVALSLPLMLFAGGDYAYRSLNRRYFGVPYATVRTEGAIAGFFERLYRIQDDNKDAQHWVPWTTVEKAVQASPTLQAHPELVNQLRTGSFARGNWGDGPSSDMPVWAAMWDLMDIGMFDNQMEPQRLFEQINAELDEANLPQMEGFSPTALLPRKTLGEIWDLRSAWLKTMRTSVLWDSYTVGTDVACDSNDDESLQRCRLIERTLNESFARTGENTMADKRDRLGMRIASIIIKSAKYVGPVVFGIGAIGVMAAFITLLSRKHRWAADTWRWSVWSLLVVVLLAAGASALTLAVSWQYSWRDIVIFKYYTSQIVPLVQITEILGAATLLSLVLSVWNKRGLNSDEAIHAA